VARPHIKTVANLKGATVVLQQGGPHVGLLDDVLKTAKLGWSDINVIWARDLTGTPQSPAEQFRANPKSTPASSSRPTWPASPAPHRHRLGRRGHSQGRPVLVSTAELSRSIADVYVCRKDFFTANADLVTKFAAGYLKACEEVIELKKQYEGKGSPKYMELLKLTQSIYGKK